MTTNQIAETNNDLVPYIELRLSLEETEALHKTLGISLQHLMSKLGRSAPGSKAHETASQDFGLLSNVQQALLTVMKEVNSYVG